MPKYKGEIVTVERKATAGDVGFIASEDQVVVKLGNGEHKVVLKKDVKD